jgi:hypothetical protein
MSSELPPTRTLDPSPPQLVALPDGQITPLVGLVSPAKIFRWWRRANQWFDSARLTREGADRESSRTVRWDAMDATASGAQGIAGRVAVSDDPARDERRCQPFSPELCRAASPDGAFSGNGRGRRSRVDLVPQAGVKFWEMHPARPGFLGASSIPGRRGLKSWSPRGDHEISRNPLRGESRVDPVALWSTRALLCTTAGAIGARLSLRPSLWRVKRMQTSGDQRREKADARLRGIFNCHRPVKPGQAGRRQRRDYFEIRNRTLGRHCEEHLRRLVRRSSTSEGGSNPCFNKPRGGLLRFAPAAWLVPRPAR